MSVTQRVDKPRLELLSKRAISPHNLTWDGVTYSRVPPGIYDGVGCGVQGPEWCRAYRRWSLRIEFALLSEDVRVSRFFNLGSDPLKPVVGRQSIYFKWWTAANGELPRRGQKMLPDVFLEGQVFRLEVEDARMDAEQQAKHDAEVYSRVGRLHGVCRAQTSSLSIVQSGIIPSPNQAINQSSRPPGRKAKKP